MTRDITLKPPFSRSRSLSPLSSLSIEEIPLRNLVNLPRDLRASQALHSDLALFELIVSPDLLLDEHALSVLSLDESARAAQISDAGYRRQFLASRYFLRLCLSERLGCEMKEISLVTTTNGKPRLALLSPPLQFSISHSAGRILFGLSTAREIGVDIEYSRERTRYQKIAARFFTPYENEVLARAPESEQYMMFLKLWVCKEAVIKALGSGMFQHVLAVEIEIREREDEEDEIKLRNLPAIAGQCESWSVRLFQSINKESWRAVALAPPGLQSLR